MGSGLSLLALGDLRGLADLTDSGGVGNSRKRLEGLRSVGFCFWMGLNLNPASFAMITQWMEKALITQ